MKRVSWSILTVALALMGVVVGHSPARAQQALGSVASTVAGCWSRRDAEGIAELLSRGGVALHLLDESHPAAGVRQARAALAALFERGGSVRVSKVQELGGEPPRGFAELAWEVRGSGSDQGLAYTVFVGFVREGDAWRIGEIRVLR